MMRKKRILLSFLIDVNGVTCTIIFFLHKFSHQSNACEFIPQITILGCSVTLSNYPKQKNDKLSEQKAFKLVTFFCFQFFL